MGITIHYTLILSDYRELVRVLKASVEAAKAAGWRWKHVRRRGKAVFIKTTMSDGLEADYWEIVEWLRERYGEVALNAEPPEKPDGPPFAYIWRNSFNGYSYAYPYFQYHDDGEEALEGIVIDSGVTESFSLCFYRIGRHYFCSNFTKTQPFTAESINTCMKFHVFVCEVLKTIDKNMTPWHLKVIDEGEYYETGDVKRLAELFGANARQIWGYTAMIQKALNNAGIPAKALIAGQYTVKPYQLKTKQTKTKTRRGITNEC